MALTESDKLAQEIRALVFKYINFVQQDEPWPILDEKIASLLDSFAAKARLPQELVELSEKATPTGHHHESFGELQSCQACIDAAAASVKLSAECVNYVRECIREQAAHDKQARA